jgi:hypothetical protein
MKFSLPTVAFIIFSWSMHAQSEQYHTNCPQLIISSPILPSRGLCATFCNMLFFFLRWGVVPHSVPVIREHHLVCGLLIQYLPSYPPCLGGSSSIRNQRTRDAVVTKNSCKRIKNRKERGWAAYWFLCWWYLNSACIVVIITKLSVRTGSEGLRGIDCCKEEADIQ